MSQQEELLLKLYTLYKKRYNGQALERKFNDAAVDLVETGDITKAAYITFCADNDIEPDVIKTKVAIKNKSEREESNRLTSDHFYNYDPCGRGGYTRSGC